MLSERQAYLALSRLSARRVAQLLAESGGSAVAAARRGGCAELALPDPFVTLSDAEYPAALRELPDPPPVLFHAGALPPARERCVAVVGTRRASNYGLAQATRLGRDLAEAGLVVISGLARGIDGAAHRGCLERGPTVAVLGCGLDVNYPPEHGRLQRDIAARGGLLSEYRPGTPPERWRFPARNRLVAALAAAVVVVEAPRGSGALITVDQALELGREVLVFPGPVGSRESEGALALLREGATLARGAEDVLEALGREPGARPATETDWLLPHLTANGSTADEVQAATGRPIGEVLAHLTRLQVTGRVSRGRDGRWLSLG